jgi:hypothetical protein
LDFKGVAVSRDVAEIRPMEGEILGQAAGPIERDQITASEGRAFLASAKDAF